MPVNFKIPASPAVQVYENDTFLGVDFTTDIGNVDDNKSPDAVNMIRSIPGKVRKRMGYEKVGSFGTNNPIYGVHYYSHEKMWFIHAGHYLYKFQGGSAKYWIDRAEDMSTSKVVQTEDEYAILFKENEIETAGTPLYTQMARAKSTSFELNQMLVILDGYKMLFVAMIDGTLTCGRMENYPDLTVPIVRISCSPDGAGTDYQAFNLLTPRFEQDFIIDSDHSRETTLQLYTDRLANDTVEMELMRDDGTWQALTEGTHFTVNRTTGEVTLCESTPRLHPIIDASLIFMSATYTVEGVTIDISDIVQSSVSYTSSTVGYMLTWDQQYNESNAADFEIVIRIHYSYDGETRESNFYHAYHSVGNYVEPSGLGYKFRFGTTKNFTEALTFPDPIYFPITPIAGQDNVKVRATYIPNTAGTELINHCRFGVLFGVNGACDRLFVSGNPYSGNDYDSDGNIIGTYQLRNRDWYSEQNDPTYFPDTGYSIVGADTSAIMGYAIVNSFLATFKDNTERSQTVFVREGNIIVTSTDAAGNEITMPAFKLVNTLQGAGAISSYCFDYFEVEPIFLSKKGIYALTTQDITGERYAQNRSYFLDAKLLKEHNLDKAMGMTWKDYYVVCVNNHMYILDGLQPIHTDKGSPYALRQYASFYFEVKPRHDTHSESDNITCIWEMYGKFYFGTDKGAVFCFYTNDKDKNSYIDQNSAINAWWTTPDITGKLFYKNKTFRYVALTVLPAKDSSIVIEDNKHGVWKEVKEDITSIHIFSFEGLTFVRNAYGLPRFSFICDDTQRVIPTKIRVKKVDKLQYRFSNARRYEPMGFNNFALEYTQGGNLK